MEAHWQNVTVGVCIPDHSSIAYDTTTVCTVIWGKLRLLKYNTVWGRYQIDYPDGYAYESPHVLHPTPQEFQ
jgi:hypothetical protein